MKYQDNLPKLKLCNLKTHMIFLPKNEFFKLHNHRGDSKKQSIVVLFCCHPFWAGFFFAHYHGLAPVANGTCPFGADYRKYMSRVHSD